MPEIFHELEEDPGVVLAYDAAGADRGNSHKITKELASYDADARAVLDFLADHPSCTGKLGSIGICIGGHLSLRAAFNPDVRAAACFYATDIHKRGLGQGMNDDSLDRFGEIRGELLMIWGRQDPHIPREGRERIHAALEDAGTRFSWLEVNGQHAFGRDEGPRSTPSLHASASDTCWICSTAGLGKARRKWPLTVGRSRPDTERQATDADWTQRVVAHPPGSPQNRSCPPPTLRGWPDGPLVVGSKKTGPNRRRYVADGSPSGHSDRRRSARLAAGLN